MFLSQHALFSPPCCTRCSLCLEDQSHSTSTHHTVAFLSRSFFYVLDCKTVYTFLTGATGGWLRLGYRSCHVPPAPLAPESHQDASGALNSFLLVPCSLPKAQLECPLLRPLPQARAGHTLLWFPLHTTRMSHLLGVLLVAHDFASPDQGPSYLPHSWTLTKGQRHSRHWWGFLSGWLNEWIHEWAAVRKNTWDVDPSPRAQMILYRPCPLLLCSQPQWN